MFQLRRKSQKIFITSKPDCNFCLISAPSYSQQKCKSSPRPYTLISKSSNATQFRRHQFWSNCLFRQSPTRSQLMMSPPVKICKSSTQAKFIRNKLTLNRSKLSSTSNSRLLFAANRTNLSNRRRRCSSSRGIPCLTSVCSARR